MDTIHHVLKAAGRSDLRTAASAKGRGETYLQQACSKEGVELEKSSLPLSGGTFSLVPLFQGSNIRNRGNFFLAFLLRLKQRHELLKPREMEKSSKSELTDFGLCSIQSCPPIYETY